MDKKELSTLSQNELFELIGREIALNDLSALPPKPKELIKLGIKWFEMKKSRINSVVCNQWDILNKLKSDITLLASAICDLITGICAGVSPMTIAYLIIKIGLGKFCDR